MRPPALANTGLVSDGEKDGGLQAHCPATQSVVAAPAEPSRPNPPSTQTPLSPGLPLIREKLNHHNISTTATDIILASWRAGTNKQYQVYLKRWEQFCQSKGVDTFEVTVENGIDSLATLFSSGLGYSAINTARSALSSVLLLPNNTTFGSHPLVTRFLKGVFELKPSLPRYSVIWDVGVVLQYLKSLGLATELELKTLTKKMTMLLYLLTGQHCQTLTKLDINLMQTLQDKIVFTVGEKLKTTRPGRHLQPIELTSYDQDKTLCIVSHLQTYIANTHHLRGQNSKLLISYAKPHKPVSISTISKWAKTVLKEAGIDTTCFSGNSARSASTSYSVQSGLPLQDILKAGGWSNAGTFCSIL